jgi:hypothetical protein
LQKTDENVRDHHLRIIEIENALEKEKSKVNIKEETRAPETSKRPYFALMRKNPSESTVTEIGRRSVSG